MGWFKWVLIALVVGVLGLSVYFKDVVLKYVKKFFDTSNEIVVDVVADTVTTASDVVEEYLDNRFLKDYVLRGSDSKGSGHYGAPRGDRTHYGLDLKMEADVVVNAPFDLEITRPDGQVYEDTTNLNYVEFKGVDELHKDLRVRFMFVDSDMYNVGDLLNKGDAIGIMQDITERYEGIINHIHCEVYSLSTGDRLNPEQFL